MQGEARPLYAQRLNRDITELFSHNFSCSSSSLTVDQGSTLRHCGSIILHIKIFEGPYRDGCFSFRLEIPSNYPFKPVDVWAIQPIWHPNIDLYTGRVIVPLDWSPVLSLNSLALAVQMIMLEPSTENPLNLNAYSYCISDNETFDKNVQNSLNGGIVISGISFHSVRFDKNIINLENNDDDEMLISTGEKRNFNSIINNNNYKNNNMNTIKENKKLYQFNENILNHSNNLTYNYPVVQIGTSRKRSHDLVENSRHLTESPGVDELNGLTNSQLSLGSIDEKNDNQARKVPRICHNS